MKLKYEKQMLALRFVQSYTGKREESFLKRSRDVLRPCDGLKKSGSLIGSSLCRSFDDVLPGSQSQHVDCVCCRAEEDRNFNFGTAACCLFISFY